MSSFSEGNAPWKGNKKPGRKGPLGRGGFRRDAVSDDWVWGWHAVVAALANPLREKPQRLIATRDRAQTLKAQFGDHAAAEIVEPQAISQVLPQGAVHQGVALKVAMLESATLDQFVPAPGHVVLMLDQITDPQNVGTILRSAAAFGAKGVILQDRHAPKLTGTLAKAAVGAVDQIPVAYVVNLSRALETLADMGWQTLGLDGAAETTLDQALTGEATVLVLGSEGEGLRRLVADHCDVLAKISMPACFKAGIKSLLKMAYC